MVMLTAYLDESGTHTESPVLVLAGLIASPRQWERLSQRWLRALASIGVGSFHATDCANGGGDFRGIAPQERQRVFIRLVETIKQTVSYRIWTGIAVEDYRNSPYYNQDPKRIYSLASIACISLGRHLAAQRGADYRLAYTFDQGPEGTLAFDIFRNMQASGEADVLRMAEVSTGDRRQSPPLQAADLFAYEIYRYLSDQMTNTGRKIRQSLNSILSVNDGGGYFLGGRKLMELVQGMIAHPTDKPRNWRVPIPIEVDWLDKTRRLQITQVSSDLQHQPPAIGEPERS
jgi:hypothetical protein